MSMPTTKAVERRLSAILAADVAGYSRLIGLDEEDTLARLKAHRRELIEPAVARHYGRFVKLMGDGLLVEFPSVVQAVRCALQIQQGMSARNAGIAPQQRIEFRIGINLGDIVVEEGDIYGDGVNIAARLEGLADPGGICVSEKVYAEVSTKVESAFEDIGEQKLKNISSPVRAFKLRLGTASLPHVDARAALPLPDQPSLAVLPFSNMSGEPAQDYFSDGITDDIITGLARLRWLFVIARNSTFAYKGKAVDVRQVARELGVRYVLEGSVRMAGKRIRVTGQLIDAETGKHLWAEKYDRELQDIFAVQDDITQRVVAAVEPHLYVEEGSRAASKQPDSIDALGARCPRIGHAQPGGAREDRGGPGSPASGDRHGAELCQGARTLELGGLVGRALLLVPRHPRGLPPSCGACAGRGLMRSGRPLGPHGLGAEPEHGGAA
jgi:adenylate cyclase